MRKALVIIAVAVGLALPSAALAGQPASRALPGTWGQGFNYQSQTGLELSFFSGGTWFAGTSGFIFTSGTWFSTASNRIVLAGDPSCDFVPGTYQWKRVGFVLHLYPTNDPCPAGRAQAIGNPPSFMLLGPPLPPTITATAAVQGGW